MQMQIEDTAKTTSNTSKSELWNLSLRDIFYKYIRFLPVFILSVAFALLIAYMYLRYTVPIYSVSGSMLIRSEQPGQRNNEIDQIISGSKTTSINNEIEVLKSVPLMERVVNNLKLQNSYSAKGKIKTLNIYNQGPFILEGLEINDSSNSFTLNFKFQNDQEFRVNDSKTTFTFNQVFKNEFGAFRLIRKPNSSVSKEYSVTWTPTYAAASNYAGALQVTLKSANTGILYISIRTTNSKMGADIINNIMQEYELYSVE